MASVRRKKTDMIDEEELAHFVEMGYTRKQLATRFNVCPATIGYMLRKKGLRKSDITSRISDDALDDIVKDAINAHPNWGMVLMQGFLESIYIKVQRVRVRESMARVDPDGIERRKTTTLKRRVYSVEGPNSLWHLDGNHKLIRWRLVIHGCIDGYSRIIPFLTCSNNNKAATVLQGFHQGVTEFGVPQKVRTDKGMENVDVCTYMLEHQGTGTYITGKSVHNQRIERLWRDINVNCSHKYSTLFYQMEDNGNISPDNDTDMFCLHYMFIPIINATLAEFREAWHHHKLSSEQNKSPLQIWSDHVSLGFPVDEPDQDAGVGTGSSDEEDDDDDDVAIPGAVHVPHTMQLTAPQIRDLSTQFPVRCEHLAIDDDRIAYFLALKEYVTRLVV